MSSSLFSPLLGLLHCLTGLGHYVVYYVYEHSFPTSLGYVLYSCLSHVLPLKSVLQYLLWNVFRRVRAPSHVFSPPLGLHQILKVVVFPYVSRVCSFIIVCTISLYLKQSMLLPHAVSCSSTHVLLTSLCYVLPLLSLPLSCI